TRSSRQATVGRPGDATCPRYSCTARCRSLTVTIDTSIVEVLRRPIDSAQYLPIRYTERLAAEGAITSVGSRGDSYDCDDPRVLLRSA
ncbi:MAG TPA: hypothetical protein VGV93_04865, partial [Acidimicrobiales bacterium]|nr:hypothetical protein [Acidimicrobiales bacterium]